MRGVRRGLAHTAEIAFSFRSLIEGAETVFAVGFCVILRDGVGTVPYEATIILIGLVGADESHYGSVTARL